MSFDHPAFGGVPKPLFEERIMPAIMTGYVVLWKEETDQKKGDEKTTEVASKSVQVRYKPIKFDKFKIISVYVPDENTETSEVVPLIIAEFIKKNGDDPNLWKAYGKGLLQVYDVEKMVVIHPPRIPYD